MTHEVLSGEILIHIEDLSVRFGVGESAVQAVNDISLVIPKGGTLGLVGESGSGKSVTALSVLNLLPQPAATIISGQIYFNDQDVLRLKEPTLRTIRGNEIAMVFQEPMSSLNPVFRVGQQVAEVLRLHKKMKRRQAKQRTIELFDLVGIPDPARRYNSYPHEMSGGQLQRVMIAMAISCEPQLLICDEPTTALDVTVQKQVLGLLKKLQSELGMTMLFISHDLAVVAEMADQVAVMRNGEVVEEGTAVEVFENPQHPYTQGLLACRPQLNNNPERLLTVADFLRQGGQPTKTTQPQSSMVDYASKPLLEVNDLATYFPIKSGLFGRVTDHVKAVDGVSFKVYRGETLGLVGESGCGKTTLGRTLMRLQNATRGQVGFDGINVLGLDVTGLRQFRSRMQMVFQDPFSSLNPRMRVAQSIAEPLNIHRADLAHSARTERVVELLEQVDINPDHRHRYPHEFSGGQRQRIAIARALAVEPELLICDESVSALDVSVQAQVLNLLKDLQDVYGLTYIFVSHDLAVIDFMSDRVGVMKQGQLVELDTVETIYNNPAEPYTQQLIDAIPQGIINPGKTGAE